MRSFGCAETAFDYLADLERAQSVEQITGAMKSALARFGAGIFILAELPLPQENIDDVAKNWPQEWFDLYSKRAYMRVDPVVRFCRRQSRPFDWTEAPYDHVNEPRSHEVMRLAKEFGIAQGFCVPVPGIFRRNACLSISGFDMDLAPRARGCPGFC